MKKIVSIIIFMGTVLLFVFLCRCPAQDNIDSSENNATEEELFKAGKLFSLPLGTTPAEQEIFIGEIKKYSPVQAYLERVTAIMLDDLSKVWELTSNSLKQEEFVGSFDNLKESPRKIQTYLDSYTIDRVYFQSPGKVRIGFRTEIEMIKEDGKWKYAGNKLD